MQNSLSIPPEVNADPESLELLRVWAAQGRQHVSLETAAWDDPAAWGIMLVDIAKHVASAYHQSTGKDPILVLKRLKEGFDAEWQHATDTPSGHLE